MWRANIERQSRFVLLTVSSISHPDYQNCFDSMRRAGLPFNPSEAHGMAVGILGSHLRDAARHWKASVYADLDPNDALVSECRVQLDELFDLAGRQLADDQFGLALFLPGDSQSELDAATALRDWAQGFLYGFGLAGEEVMVRLSPEGKEALQDFYEIAQMEVNEESLDEQELNAVAEIEEYMRVAAMLLNQDLKGQY